jgi:hypothetical protein
MAGHDGPPVARAEGYLVERERDAGEVHPIENTPDVVHGMAKDEDRARPGQHL